MNPSRPFAFALLLLSSPGMHAEPAPTVFPPDAVAPTAEALEKQVSGNAFDIALADGSSWRFDYRGNGSFFVNTSRGLNASGTWKVQDDKVCTDGPKINRSCNEFRVKDDALYMKRDNGDVVRLVKR